MKTESMKSTPFRLLLAVFAIYLFSPIIPAQAALGGSGWMTMLSDIVGDDASCGAGKVKQELYLRELGTGNPLSVGSGSALFTSIKNSDWTTVDSVTGSGPSVGSICFDPDTQSFGIDVRNVPGHDDFLAAYHWINPASLLRGKLMRTTVWIAPTSAAPAAYIQTFPLNSLLKTSPAFQFNLNSFPATYGATGLSKGTIIVRQYDLLTGTFGAVVRNSDYPLNGGVGSKGFPAGPLLDGVYAWAFYASLNGSHNAGGGNTVTEDLKTGFAGYYWPFILDTTPVPTQNVYSHFSPSRPFSTDNIWLNVDVTDDVSGSGINQVQIFSDSPAIPVRICNFSSTHFAHCFAVVGPFPAGSSHPFYAKILDGSNNLTESTPLTFTIGTKGVCGSANGVVTNTIPMPSSPAPPNNLCQVSYSSSQPTANAYSFLWNCNGADGMTPSPDDVQCSAPILGATGICDPATNGVATERAPTSNLCQSGTAGTVAVSGASFRWTCSGIDNATSLDDDTCSAPITPTLKICANSCTSGSTPYNRPYLDRFPAIPTTLYACYGIGTCTAPDLNVSGTWHADNTPMDAIELTNPVTNLPTTSGMTVDITRSYIGTETRQEDIRLSYGTADPVTATAEVICVPLTCETLRARTDGFCDTEAWQFDDNCGGKTDFCPGTRYCDFNMRESTP